MAETPLFTAPELEFAESVGLRFDALGLPRIGGRIFGLLIVSPRPLSLDEIASVLGISRASVSINTRLFIANGSMEIRAVPGDRRQYYAMRKDVFYTRLPFIRGAIAGVKALAVEAQAAVQEGQKHRAGNAELAAGGEPVAAWGTLRASDAPGPRLDQALLFLAFVEAQLEEIEVRFRATFGAKP